MTSKILKKEIKKKDGEGLFKGAYPVTESAYCRFKQIQLRQWR